MSTTGCSATPLPRKLGIATGTRMAWLRAPDDFARLLGEMPEDVRLKAPATAPVDLVIRKELR